MDLTFESDAAHGAATKSDLLAPQTSSKPSSSSSFPVQQLFSRHGVRMLFQAFDDKKIDGIKPHVTKGGALVYLEAAKVMGIGVSQIPEILEDLAREDLLTKRPTTPLFKCPDCDSPIATESILCPNCRTTGLQSGATLQHLPCLNFDFDSNFQRRDGFAFCPRCDRKLVDLGSDYLQPGTFFKCIRCGEFTARALWLHTCGGCQKVFETTKEAAIQAYEYRLNDKKRDLIARYLVDANYHHLFDALELCGLQARKSNVLEGKSGVSHSFTIVANRKGSVNDQKVVVIDAIVSMVGVDSSAVLAFLAKVLDCKVKDAILLVVPELEDDAKVLAQSYNITYVESEHSIAEAAEKLQKILKQRSVHNNALLSNEGELDAKLQQRMKNAKRHPTRKRGSLDIMTDILTVASTPSSKTEIMSCANLSYDQCQKYLPSLQKIGLLRKFFVDGIHTRFAITEKGREYLSSMSVEFGRIAEGDKSVWTTRRQAESLENDGPVKK
jgi:predicted transcriptional regulator